MNATRSFFVFWLLLGLAQPAMTFGQTQSKAFIPPSLQDKLAVLRVKLSTAQKLGHQTTELQALEKSLERQIQEAEKTVDQGLKLLEKVEPDPEITQAFHANVANGTLAGIQTKIEKIQRFFSAVQIKMAEAPRLMQEGELASADQALDKALALLGETPEEGFETLGPKPEEIHKKMEEIQTRLLSLAEDLQKVPELVHQGQVQTAEELLSGLEVKIVKLNPTAFQNLPAAQTPAEAGPNSEHKALHEKMQKVFKAVQAAQNNGRDLSTVAPSMEKIGPLVQQGKFQEAERLVDELLKNQALQ